MTKIFVVSHKELPYSLPSLYVPIQVNAEKLGDLNGFSERDNTQIHISPKNENYCELTASYWIWKNESCSVVGFCHYRRFFNFYNPFYNTKPSSQKSMTLDEFLQTKNATQSSENITRKIENYLQKYDVILPKPAKQKLGEKQVSLSEYYMHEHGEKEWKKTLEIIVNLFPEYEKSIDLYLNNSSVFYYANMMITTKQIWNEYHSWLFAILFEVEKNIEIPKDDYQKRIFGFLSERLLNVYFQHNNKFKIKHLPLIYINNV